MYGYEELASYTSGDIRCNDSLLGLRFYETKNTDKVIHAYEARINELEKAISDESKWIPVYYELPDYGKIVRVRTINSNREVKEGTASFHDGGDWNKDYWSKHGDTVGRITHWMPFPSASTNDEK